MPSVGDLYFDIAAKDSASTVITDSIEKFKSLQNTAIDAAASISTAFAATSKASDLAAAAQQHTGNIIVMTANDYNRATEKIGKGHDRMRIPDKTRESVSAMADAFAGLEDTILNSLKSFTIFVVALEGIADFSKQALEVARTNEVLRYRIDNMAEAMNYGRIATEEGAAALRDYVASATPSQLRTIKELSEDGFNMQFAMDNMSMLKDAALIAGTSVESMYSDFGRGGEALRKYNITEDIISMNRVAIRATQLQQDHWVKYHRALDSGTARAQAAMEIYSGKINEYVDSNSEFFNTAEGAMARLTLATEKFQNAVGKIYNVGLAPILNTIADILSFIADNPALRFVTAIGLVAASVAVLSVTLLPKLVTGMSNLVTGMALGAKTATQLLTVNRAQLIMSFKQISANKALSWEIINQNILKYKEFAASARGIVAKTADTAATNAQTAALFVNNETMGKNVLLIVYATAVKTKRTIATKLETAADIVRNVVLRKQNTALLTGNILTSTAAKVTAALGATQIAATFASGGLAAGFTAMGAAAWAALTPILPILLPILAVIGAIILAWKAYETNFAGFKTMIDGFIGIIKTCFEYLKAVGTEIYNSFIEPIQTALQPLFEVFHELGATFSELGSMFGFAASEGGFFVDVLNIVKLLLGNIWAMAKPMLYVVIIPALKFIASFMGKWIAGGILLIANGLKNLMVIGRAVTEVFLFLAQVLGKELDEAFKQLSENPVVQFLSTLIDKITEFLKYVGILPTEVPPTTTAATTKPAIPAKAAAYTGSTPAFSPIATQATAIDYSRSPTSGGTSVSTGGITANINISGMTEAEATAAIDAALKNSENRQLRSIQSALHTGIEKYINY